MGIVICEADLQRDKEVLIQTLNQNRTRSTDEQRYHWRYLENPHGQAKAWIAVDNHKDAIAGFTVAHPRLMQVYDEQMLCWNCGDFSINKHYRSLGVALKLRSAATECVTQGQVSFLYAHPNDRMKVVHLKVGHKVLGQMVRYARVLRFDRYLPASVAGSWFAEGLAWVHHHGFVPWKNALRCGRPYSREIFHSFPGEAAFDVLQDQVRGALKVYGVRSGEYLRWRFGTNPLLPMSTLLLYRNRELVGYAFYSKTGSVMNVHDLFCLPEEAVSSALIAHLTEVGLEQKLQALSVVLFESNPLIHALKQHGYVLRPETSSVIVHTSPETPWGLALLDKTSWFMTVGDRDV
jgi:hypothetical protein